MTLNSGTLIGLLLAIGRLVDDSIIDIHAVERHMRMGKDPKHGDHRRHHRGAAGGHRLHARALLALTPLLFCGRHRAAHVRRAGLADHLRAAGLDAGLVHPDGSLWRRTS